MLLAMKNTSGLFGNGFMKFSIMVVGSVYCESLRESFLGVLYLYLWYNHATYVSNGWVGGSRLCGLCSVEWYWSHNHFSLVFGMVIRCLPMLSCTCAMSCWV